MMSMKKEKKRLKVGDRCAFYDVNGRHVGTVRSAGNSAYIGVMIQAGIGPRKQQVLVHRKQCRRLRPRAKKPAPAEKVRMEVWIPAYTLKAHARGLDVGKQQYCTIETDWFSERFVHAPPGAVLVTRERLADEIERELAPANTINAVEGVTERICRALGLSGGEDKTP
jgi:hypothetical protein